MSLEKLSIVPLDTIDRKLIDYLLAKLAELFKIRTFQFGWDAISEIDRFEFRFKLKYRSTELINFFSKNLPEDSGKILFLTSEDLYSPVFSRYFGEAELNGRVGIISAFHLKENLSDLPNDTVIFYSRVEKEALHETGHLFGLIHCSDPNCVMKLSGKISDIDTKSPVLCSNCMDVLKNSTQTV